MIPSIQIMDTSFSRASQFLHRGKWKMSKTTKNLSNFWEQTNTIKWGVNIENWKNQQIRAELWEHTDHCEELWGNSSTELQHQGKYVYSVLWTGMRDKENKWRDTQVSRWGGLYTVKKLFSPNKLQLKKKWTKNGFLE